jgi:SET family sugar efflux transporter-like MFS transporter
MTIFARVFRLVWGGDVDRALRPVLAVSLVGSIAGASAYPFMAIWAIKELHAPQGTLAFSYLIGAGLAGLTGYGGGHLSDYIGRRPLILFGWGFQALVPLALIAVGDHTYLGLALLSVMPAFGSLGGAADTAMVADLVAPERHEAAYASVRVAANLGVTIGPPIGGLLLVGGHWNHLWVGTLVLSTIGFAIAYRYIPRGGGDAPQGAPERRSVGVSNTQKTLPTKSEG